MLYSTLELDTLDRKETQKAAGRRRAEPPRPPTVPPEEPTAALRDNFFLRLRRHRPAYGALCLLVILVLCAVSAPLLSPGGEDVIELSQSGRAPSLTHPFGTDDLGRDVMVRVLYGGRRSLAVAATAMLVALLIGLGAGGVAGYYGGWIDAIIARTADLMLSIPSFLVILMLSSVIDPGFLVLCILIGFVQWMEVARVVRSVVISTRELAYVEAARALGATDHRILRRHILPQTAGPVFVAATLGIAHAIMMESALSFLGFGVDPSSPSWGAMLRNAQANFGPAPWVAVFPGLMIFLTVMCCYILGEFLRNSLGSEGFSRR
jgi:peptide/nickel transport system permease protein